MTRALHAGDPVGLCWPKSPGRPRRTEPPTLATVLDRAGAYVAEFHRQLSGIVARGDLRQDWKTIWRATDASGAVKHGHRVTQVGDLLLVKPPGADAWVEFRDVFEVDGTPVRDRDERLVNAVSRRLVVDRRADRRS